MFLMYRVELKDTLAMVELHRPPLFLMYRVELKVCPHKACPFCTQKVPNVPCGVESHLSNWVIDF